MSEDPRAFGPRSSIGRSTRARSPLSVLLVDADAQRNEEVRLLLAGDCIVATASSVQAALSVIAQRVPDLIVCDLDLPDASGMVLINRVHRDPTTRDTLLMVVTSRASIRDKIAALQAGADDYLVRPLDPARFSMRVQLVSHFRRTLRL